MIAILGGTGMLGDMLVKYFSERNAVVATARNKERMKPIENVEWRYLDARDLNKKPLLMNAVLDNCEWVINAIGSIPQRVEGNNSGGYAINATVPLILSEISHSDGLGVIHISTDCVYSGDTGDYDEGARHDAHDDYGISKSMGEVIGTSIYNLRCSIIGLEPYGSYSLLGWFMSQLEGAKVKGFTNHFWNGVTTYHFAQACERIMNDGFDLPSVQHLVPADRVSKYELLCYFKEKFRPDITVEPALHNKPVNRTLATKYPDFNNYLWGNNIPTVRQMVCEFKKYVWSSDGRTIRV